MYHSLNLNCGCKYVNDGLNLFQTLSVVGFAAVIERRGYFARVHHYVKLNTPSNKKSMVILKFIQEEYSRSTERTGEH